MTVSSEQRGGLSRAVSRLRVLFEDDYAGLLEGTFGIHVSGRRAGEIEDPDSLSLSAHQLAARAELVGVVEYLRGESLDAVEAVERMLREAVFTTVNRLLAVRVAEAIGVLPPSLSEGRSSLGFVETIELFPLLRDADVSDGYWSYLQVCGDELSHAVPRLFDRRHPLSVLEPSSETVDAAVEILSDPELAGVWVEPEALGWSYQFFNTQEERRKMRDESSAPRDSRELAVRNQFFTPSYVVDFLVENTLGRRLRESGSELELPLLLGDVPGDAPLLDLKCVSVLDPAVGSGHFLLGAYDLLERAWEERGIPADEAAPRILASLYGVDIDARATQVAQAVLYLRARRSAPAAVLDPPSIVTARALPKDPAVWAEVLADAPALVRDVVEGLGEVLEQALVLGSLLKPEEYLREAIGERLYTPQLGDESLGSFEDVEVMVLAAAGRIASEASSSPAERLFAADTTDALGFVEVMARRYDTVLMNPPFGAPAVGTKQRLKLMYPDGSRDLFAAFVARGRALLAEKGYIGALTNRTGLFNVTLEDWRRQQLPSLVAAADLGHGVLQDALVEVAAYVLSRSVQSRPFVVRRLLDAGNKAEALANRSREDSYKLTFAELDVVPGLPFAYDLSPAIRSVYERLPGLEGPAAEVRQGLATADDFRFLRLHWETRSRDRGEWIPFAKGGQYSPFYADIHLVIDWSGDGDRVRDYPNSVVRNPKYYFREGLTWPVFSTSALGVHPLPSGSIFSHVGIAALPEVGVHPGNVGAVLNSRLGRHLLSPLLAAGEETSSGTARNVYGVGQIQRIPWAESPVIVGEMWTEIAKLTRSLRGEGDETTHAFVSTGRGSTSRGSLLTTIMELAQRIEERLVDAYGLDQSAMELVDAAEGPHPASYPSRPAGELGDLRRLALLSDDQLVNAAMERRGTARYLATKSYVADRRVELMSHILRANPGNIIKQLDEWELDWPEDQLSAAEDRLSYVVGGGLGRWDVRVGRDPSLAPELGGPFDPLPVCSPGMLTGDDGLPVTKAPGGYPINLPSDRILFDDPGHEWDIVRQIVSVAEFLFDDPDGELREVLGRLKVKDLRAYLRSKFFSQHLRRYSKSRRRAPIYWYLAVPSKEWGLWVYAPWLSREQLFAIARAAQDKMRRLADEASQLRRDVEAGGGRADRERLEAVEVLMEEITEFHRVADSVAQSGWEPDLNDGIILNAAPLQGLFADKKWRTDIEKHRKKMIDGDYPWATVQTTYYDRIES